MIVLTGFGPFGADGSVAQKTNPSERLAIAAGRKLKTKVRILPVRFDIGRVLPDVVAAADLVVGIGVAGSRTTPKLEKLAVNWQESLRPDITGVVLDGRPVEKYGPDIVRTGWDLDRVSAECGIEVSLCAGTYVCNTLAYCLYRQHRNACFLHIPPTDHLGLTEGVELVERIIECSMSA